MYVAPITRRVTQEGKNFKTIHLLLVVIRLLEYILLINGTNIMSFEMVRAKIFL